MNTIWINIGVLLALLPVGTVMAWFILRRIDRLNGVSFGKDIQPKILTDPKATAIYFGLRFFAVLYFVSALVSRFV